MSRPLVSVITAVRNRAGVLPRCIESVLRQDYPLVEHLVVDGGSTDGTVDVLDRYRGVLAWSASEPDRGVFDAWNKALARARGEWIAFLGADDAYLPDAVSRYVEAAAANPATEYISSRVELVRPGGSRIIGQPWTWTEFRRHMCVAHVGSFHRASLFRRLGGYDVSYRIVGDYELLLRAGPTLSAAFLDAVTARMAAGGQSDSTAALAEARRAKLRHGAKRPLGAAFDHAVAYAKHHGRHALAEALAR